MNKKRLGKFIALSSVFVLSSITGAVVAGCSGCNKHEHNLTEVAAVAPTCTTDGRSAYYVCGCGMMFSDAEGKTEIAVEDTVIVKLGHDLEHHAADPATCTKPGTIEYWECTRCDDMFSDAAGTTLIENVEYTKEHTWGDTGHHAQVDPTTDAEGTLEYWHCSECDLIYADSFGDRQVTLDELKIDRVSENIDGKLTEEFYPTENALIIGGADVKEGGKGIIINAVTASDGVYLHIVVNYNIEATKQPAGKGKIGLYFNVRNSEILNLPGGAGDCLSQAMLMELYLTGNVDYHKPYFLKKFDTKENEGALTKYTSTWEMFIPHSGFATVNNGVFAEGFETVEGKTVLKSGYTYMVTAIGALDPSETFANNGASQCDATKDGNTWAFWFNEGHGDWANTQKYYILGAQGVTLDFQRATDTYRVNVNDYNNAEITGLTETVDYDKKLQGTVTVDEGYRLSGIIVNGQIFTFKKAEDSNTYDYEIAVADLKNLKWNDTELTVEIVITKLEYQTVEITFKGVANGKTESIAQGTSVTLMSVFGDDYTEVVGADGKVTFEEILCLDYTVKINNYVDALFTVVKGENTAESVLEYHFAHNAGTRPDLVDLTHMNAANASITLGAQGENGLNGQTPSGEDNVISVQLNLSEEMKNAEAYVLYTTVTVNGDIIDGAGAWLQRFGIRFAEGDSNSTYNNKFVVWWNDLGLNSTPSAIWANDKTYCGGAEDRQATYGWLASSILDGLPIKVVRNGSYITISVYSIDDDEWYTLLSGTTSADAQNDITFFVSGESFTFSEISYEVLKKIDRVYPQGDTVGKLEHLEASNGDIFLLNGEITTDADLVLKAASVSVSVNAFEKDGKTEVALEDGTQILLTGKFETYTYTVGETLMEMLEDEYEAFLYGYGKVKFTVEDGATIKIDLVKTIAYTSTDQVTVDQNDGTIYIAAQDKNSDRNWTGSAEPVISQDIGTYLVFETTIKMGDIEEGWTGHSTEQRYAIQMTESGKGFYLWSWKDGVSKSSVRGLLSLTDCMEEGEDDNIINGNEAGNGWIYDAIVSNSGLQVRVIRLGDTLILTALNVDEYAVIGSIKCGADDANKIVLYGVTASFEFSDYSAKKLTYVEAEEATLEKAGNIAHYTDGTNYYLTNGTPTTKEVVIIPQIVEKAVEITVEVYDTDGKKVDVDLSNIKVTLTGEYDYNKNIYTELAISNGKVELENGTIYEGKYSAIVNGYAVDGIAVGEDTSALTLKLYQISSYQIVEVEKTCKPEQVITGFNSNGVSVKLIGAKGANSGDMIWDEYEKPVPEATLKLPEEIVNSKNVLLEFNLKLSNEGFYGSNAFGVSIVKDYSGFILRTFDGTSTTVCELYAQKLCEDHMKELGVNAWIKGEALSAGGLNMRVVRTGTVIVLYVQDAAGDWFKLYQISCAADAETEIKLMGAASDFEISNIVVSTAPAAFATPDGSVRVSEEIVYHQYVAPQIDSEGCEAYYSVGGVLYTASGEKTTLEDLKIEKLAPATITLTVKGYKDGEEYLLSGTVTATGEYGTSFSGTLEEGIAQVDAYVVKYSVSVDGYVSKEFTVVEGQSAYELVLDYEYAVVTGNVDISNMNNAVSEITIVAQNKDGANNWTGSAQLVLDENIGIDVVFETNIKMSVIEEGWTTHSTQQRYAIRMTESGKGFYMWMWKNGGSCASVRPIGDINNCMSETGGNNLVSEEGDGWIYDLLISDNGADFRVVRCGSIIMLNIKKNGEWVSLASITCDEDDKTQIAVYGVQSQFKFTGLTASALTAVSAKAPSETENGNLAYYYVGENYYTPDGKVVTLEQVTLYKIKTPDYTFDGDVSVENRESEVTVSSESLEFVSVASGDDWPDYHAEPVKVTINQTFEKDKAVEINFNLKGSNPVFWASNRFGIEVAGKNGLFVWNNENAGLTCGIVDETMKTETLKLGEFGWFGNAIASDDGANIKLIRIGDTISCYAQNDSVWVYLGSVACSEDDDTEIAFIAKGANWTVSGLTVTEIETITE